MLRSEDAQVRFYHLFVLWKRMQCSDFSWDAVIKVLQSQTINQPTLAERVLRQLENSTMNTDSTCKYFSNISNIFISVVPKLDFAYNSDTDIIGNY